MSLTVRGHFIFTAMVFCCSLKARCEQDVWPWWELVSCHFTVPHLIHHVFLQGKEKTERGGLLNRYNLFSLFQNHWFTVTSLDAYNYFSVINHQQCHSLLYKQPQSLERSYRKQSLMSTRGHQEMKNLKVYFTLLAPEHHIKWMAWKVFDFIQLLMRPLLNIFSRVYGGIITLECENRIREQHLQQMVHLVLLNSLLSLDVK